MKKRILFVCLGNICRSPAAEGVFRHKVSEAGLADCFDMDSAGTYGGHRGDLPDSRMRAAAQKRGYDLVHRSRQVCADDFDLFDIIIAMDDSNYERLSRLAPSPEGVDKIYRMAEFLSRRDYDHIPDPYYEGISGFELVLDLLEEGCDKLLHDLKIDGSTEM